MKYDFIVPSFQIKDTRAKINDTDYASLAIAALNADGTTAQTYGPTTQYLGDVDNGTHLLGMAIRGIDIPDGGSMAVVFTIANKGSSAVVDKVVGDFNTVCQGIIGALAGGQLAGIATKATPAAAATATSPATPAQPPAAIAIPLWEAAVGVAITLTLMELVDFIAVNCDGWVVNATFTIGRLELDQMASQAAWEWTTDYPGSDSNVYCGGNSNYTVDYQVYATSLEATVPHLFGLEPQKAYQAVHNAGLVVEASTYKANVDFPVVMGSIPDGGAIVPRSSTVQISIGVPEGGKHQLP